MIEGGCSHLHLGWRLQGSRNFTSTHALPDGRRTRCTQRPRAQLNGVDEIDQDRIAGDPSRCRRLYGDPCAGKQREPGEGHAVRNANSDHCDDTEVTDELHDDKIEQHVGEHATYNRQPES